MIISTGIGIRLREERERLGKNQTEFGALVGVSRGTQKAYELEHSSPDVGYLSTLQNLEVDVHYVVTGVRSDVAHGSLSELETTLLQAFRALSINDQETLVRAAVALSGTPRSAALDSAHKQARGWEELVLIWEPQKQNRNFERPLSARNCQWMQ